MYAVTPHLQWPKWGGSQKGVILYFQREQLFFEYVIETA